MALGLRPVQMPGTTLDMVRIEAAAITFAIGDPVIFDSNGQLTLLTAATEFIVGASAEAGAKSAGDTLLIYPARAGLTWEARATGTPTQAQIGDQVDFSVFTSALMTVDTSSTTNGQVRFVRKREFTDAFGAAMEILVVIAPDFNAWEGSHA